MTRRIWSLIVGTILLAGCQTPAIHYIVKRDVPDNPSFVVIPFNNFRDQINVANLIESALLATGVKVYQRPAAKEIEVQKSIEGQKLQHTGVSAKKYIESDETSELDSGKAEAKKTERYYEYTNINADYIVHTSGTVLYYRRDPTEYYDNIRVRIIKKSTEEVLVSTYIPPDQVFDQINGIIKSLRTGATQPSK